MGSGFVFSSELVIGLGVVVVMMVGVAAEVATLDGVPLDAVALDAGD